MKLRLRCSWGVTDTGRLALQGCIVACRNHSFSAGRAVGVSSTGEAHSLGFLHRRNVGATTTRSPRTSIQMNIFLFLNHRAPSFVHGVPVAMGLERARTPI